MGLVYLATNLYTGKSYIGITTLTLTSRRNRHYHVAKYNHDNGKKETHFGKALLKYNESIWQWSILQNNISDIKLLKQREIYWIQFYKSMGIVLYNLTNGGDGVIGYKQSYEHINTRVLAKSKTYVLLSPKGTLTTITNLSKFCRDNNLNRRDMRNVLSGKRRSSCGWSKPQSMKG